MTPSARISAAIGVLDWILDGQAAEQALLRWSRNSRYAGSKDRAAVRDLVYEALRRRNTLADRGGALSGRGLMIGLCRESGQDPDLHFTGKNYAPAPLNAHERTEQKVTSTDLPDWLMPLWREALGPDAGLIAREMGQRAPVWLRVNPLLATVSEARSVLEQDGIETETALQLTEALRVSSGERRIANSRAYRGGLVELQDLSPQLACASLPLKEGDRVLDYCAGGGGKSLALAGRQPGIRLFAHDAEPKRMADLPKRAQRAGARIERVSMPVGKFDLVVADVPCSGSGTWRRTPDAKWRLTSERLQQLTEIQSEILDKAAAFVAPGGHLAYMTCSLFEAENRGNVEAFMSRHDHFTQISSMLWTPLTASDGFFLSLLINN
ncbi:RsmB/NOP family class I SAM-dependent RNA methyltransferase [Paracoccus onubensis]|uniref:RsmB/NOP family class I SAM-dependent RNA methyltransferase n=1 Tax=Paracoccus onubensis TaxID=1675788 RepID=A0A418SRS0_9RHOB|nr:RsmB/NOP family class I SAM-dependent RNA methyltransferase [Paracoccus onubensis]RJE83661.1 RsmB/NOP family class I SAM-dependent RNA methyltransferase [Paracoccus onubensis]